MMIWATVFIQMQWCPLTSHLCLIFTSQFKGTLGHQNARFGWTSTEMPLKHSLSQAGISKVSALKVLSPVSPQFKFKIYRIPQTTELSAPKSQVKSLTEDLITRNKRKYPASMSVKAPSSKS